jgi:hypothetical protein
MKKNLIGSMLAAVALAAVYAGDAQADENRPNRPNFEDRQARLLEQFGDDGIDADGDGTLTRQEVRAFFEARPDEDRPGRRGKKGRGEDKMHRMGMALRHLDLLSAEAPPADFDLTRHADVDSDGDGAVSQAEWKAFATAKRGEILARLAGHLPNADADGDGSLSDAELESVKANSRVRLLTRNPEADTDGDGLLSPEEAEAFHGVRMEERRTQMIERHPEADTDDDGVLSDAEMHGFLPSRPGHRGPRDKAGFGDGPGHGGPRGKGHGGCGHGPKPDVPADN